jgi:excisionase family DNA binding protein
MSTSSTQSIPQSIVERIKSVERALTPDDLADLLQVSRLTVLRKAKKGIIPSFRVGSLVRFDPRAVYGWLQKQGA